MKNEAEGNLTQSILINQLPSSNTVIIEDLMQKIINKSPREKKINGIVIGKLTSLGNKGKVEVNFHLNPKKKPLVAHSTASLNKNDIGKAVAIVFQNGNSNYPVVIGLIINDENSETEMNSDVKNNEPFEILIDKKRITLNAEKEITLKCGKASITLTSAGKIIIRGKYLLSRSSGVNKIKGGSVQIN